MAGKTTQERTRYATAVAMATLSIAILATLAHPLAAQEVIELPAEDIPLDADFEDIYRVGSLDGDGWDTFGALGGSASTVPATSISSTPKRCGSTSSTCKPTSCASSFEKDKARESLEATPRQRWSSPSWRTGG